MMKLFKRKKTEQKTKPIKYHKEEQKQDETAFIHPELLSCLEEDGIWLTSEEIQKLKKHDDKIICNIGSKYYVKHDNFKAIAWYQLAATQNNSDAQFQLGFMYCYGLGVTKDCQQGLSWFLKAANNNRNKGSLWWIGWIYQYGQGVPKNIPTAIEWFTKAANQGDSYAQFTLGEIYEKENEVKDFKKAMNWYKKAADNGYESAKDCITRLNEERYYPNKKVKGKFYFKNKLKETCDHAVDEKKEEADSTNSYNTTHESNDRAVSCDRQHESHPSANQNDEKKVLQIEERMKKLEEAFQLKMNILEQGKMVLDHVKRENSYLKENFGRLQEKNKKIESELDKKDKEINRLKDALTKHSTNFDDDTNNDFSYDSSNDNEDTDDENDINNGCENSDKDDSHENDINYDSLDSEDRSNNLNYD